jgi:hypothetical protein
MSRLSEILDQMTVVLNDLKTVMDAEQQHSLPVTSTAARCSVLLKIKVRFWRRWIIWSSSDALSKILSAAPMTILLSAGRPLPKNPAPARP